MNREELRNLMEAVVGLSSLPQGLSVNTVLGAGQLPQQVDQPHLVQPEHLPKEKMHPKRFKERG